MKIASTFFVIVTLICATVALWFSAILYSARMDKVKRADYLAQAISEMVIELDKGSGTTNQQSLTFKQGTGDRPATGTLSNAEFIKAKLVKGTPAARAKWLNKVLAKPKDLSYTKFQDNLGKAVEQTKSLIAQRDEVADEIFKACQLLEIPSSLGLNQDELKRLNLTGEFESPYKVELRKILKFAVARKNRDVLISSSLIAIGKQVDVDISSSKFVDIDETGKYDLKSELDDIIKNLTALKVRNTTFSTRLTEYLTQFKDDLRSLGSTSRLHLKVDPEGFSSSSPEEYSKALNDLNEDFKTIHRRLGSFRPLSEGAAITSNQTSILEADKRELVSILNNKDKLLEHIMKTFPPSEEDQKHGIIVRVPIKRPVIEKGYNEAKLVKWDARLGWGVINKGDLDGINKGMVFIIFKTDINGNSFPLGVVRISEVRAEDSRAEFINAYETNLIEKIIGDEKLIFNGEVVEIESNEELIDLDIE